MFKIWNNAHLFKIHLFGHCFLVIMPSSHARKTYICLHRMPTLLPILPPGNEWISQRRYEQRIIRKYQSIDNSESDDMIISSRFSGKPHDSSKKVLSLRMEKLDRLLIIDGSTVFACIYTALLRNGNMRKRLLLPCFLDFLTLAIRRFKADGLAIAFSGDAGGGRGDIPGALHRHLDDMRAFLFKIPIPCLKVGRFASGDVVASLAERCIERNTEAVIVTADESFVPPAYPGVSVAMMKDGEICGTLPGGGSDGGASGPPRAGAPVESDPAIYALPVSRKDYSLRDNALYQFIDELAAIPRIRMPHAERKEYVRSVYTFANTVCISPELDERPTYANRVAAAGKLCTAGSCTPEQAAETFGVAAPDILEHLRSLDKNAKQESRDMNTGRGRGKRAQYDDGMMLEAVRMYGDAYLSFAEIQEKTGVGRWQLERHIGKNGMEKIRRKTGSKARTHRNAGKVDELILAGKTIKEVSALLEMNLNTVKKHMSGEAWRAYAGGKRGRRRAVEQIDEEKIREALRMYSDPQTKFSEIFQATGVSKQQLEKHIISRKMDKVSRRAHSNRRQHKNASQVDGLILAGKTIEEVSALLDMNHLTVRKYMSEDAWRTYDGIKQHRGRRRAAPQGNPDTMGHVGGQNPPHEDMMQKAVEMYVSTQFSFKQIHEATGIEIPYLKRYIATH